MNKAFTLVEILITIVLLGMIIILAIAAINPIEQINKAQDVKRARYAAVLQESIERYSTQEKGIPDVSPRTVSYDCSDIVQGNSVSNLGELSGELADWFARNVQKTESKLFLGISEEGKSKVCYEVRSLYSSKKVELEGCQVKSVNYLCTP